MSLNRIVSSRDHLVDFTAILAIVWVIVRACVQTITIDEADTYLAFAAPSWPSHWYPASNNHVLNSMLIRLFTSVFGPSHLTVRTPALIGAVVYILSALYLCKLLTPDLIIQWPLFVSFVYNPFILDYLVAARGYSLATAFFLTLVVIAARYALRTAVVTQRCPTLPLICCSILASFSVAANFSYAFANAAALGVLSFGVALRTAAAAPSWRQRGRTLSCILIACSAPAIAVSLLVSASVVVAWPKGQLWYGATSLVETFGTILAASVYTPNDHIINPLLLPIVQRAAPFLLGALAGIAICQAALIAVFLWTHRTRRLTQLAYLGTGISLTHSCPKQVRS